MDWIWISIILLIVLMLFVFIKSIITLSSKVKKRENFLDEILVLIYVAFVMTCVLFIIYLGADKFMLKDTGLACVILLIISSIMAVMFWFFIKIKTKTSYISILSKIVIYIFILTSGLYLIWDVHSVFFSNVRLEKLFHKNIDLYERSTRYVKGNANDLPKEKIIYKIKNNEVLYKLSSDENEKKLVDENLKKLFLDMRKKCYVTQIIVYKNRDMNFYISRGDFNLNYTEYKNIKDIYETNALFKKLDDGWYEEVPLDYLRNTNAPSDAQWDILNNR